MAPKKTQAVKGVKGKSGFKGRGWSWGFALVFWDLLSVLSVFFSLGFP